MLGQLPEWLLLPALIVVVVITIAVWQLVLPVLYGYSSISLFGRKRAYLGEKIDGKKAKK